MAGDADWNSSAPWVSLLSADVTMWAYHLFFSWLSHRVSNTFWNSFISLELCSWLNGLKNSPSHSPRLPSPRILTEISQVTNIPPPFAESKLSPLGFPRKQVLNQSLVCRMFSKKSTLRCTPLEGMERKRGWEANVQVPSGPKTALVNVPHTDPCGSPGL